MNFPIINGVERAFPTRGCVIPIEGGNACSFVLGYRADDRLAATFSDMQADLERLCLPCGIVSHTRNSNLAGAYKNLHIEMSQDTFSYLLDAKEIYEFKKSLSFSRINNDLQVSSLEALTGRANEATNTTLAISRSGVTVRTEVAKFMKPLVSNEKGFSCKYPLRGILMRRDLKRDLNQISFHLVFTEQAQKNAKLAKVNLTRLKMWALRSEIVKGRKFPYQTDQHTLEVLTQKDI